MGSGLIPAGAATAPGLIDAMPRGLPAPKVGPVTIPVDYPMPTSVSPKPPKGSTQMDPQFAGEHLGTAPFWQRFPDKKVYYSTNPSEYDVILVATKDGKGAMVKMDPVTGEFVPLVGEFHYALMPNGTMRAIPKNTKVCGADTHHSTMTLGEAVAAAGEFFSNALDPFNFMTGHYLGFLGPTLQGLYQRSMAANLANAIKHAPYFDPQ